MEDSATVHGVKSYEWYEKNVWRAWEENMSGQSTMWSGIVGGRGERQ